MPFNELLKTRLVSEKDIGTTIFRLYDNRIYHVIIKKGGRVTMEVVEEGYKFLNENGGGLFYNVYEFHSFLDVDPEVREWSASSTNNSYTILDEIVINSLPQKILADFYIRFNNPVKPTKVFMSMDKAYEWIEAFRN